MIQRLNVSDTVLTEHPEIELLLSAADSFAEELGLDDHVAFYDFPVFRDEHDELLRSQIAIIGPRAGVVLCASTTARDSRQLIDCDERLDRVFNMLYSRMLRTKSLQKNRTELAVPFGAVIFAPSLTNEDEETIAKLSNAVCRSAPQLKAYLTTQLLPHPMDPSVLRDLRGTFVGGRGLTRPKVRATVEARDRSELVSILDQLETQMASFDLKQAEGFITEISGPQRIRGLAGSGKTVVLAMKAAIAHLRHPEAKILYTFHTKSLYQHVKRLITRFYREFDDRDPDWDRLVIQHSWGGSGSPGVYYTAATSVGVPALNYREAVKQDAHDPLGYLCEQLMSEQAISPIFDFCFIDEGQDFSGSFIRLCAKLTKQNKFVLAFDELQTIFRTHTPTSADIFGKDLETGEPLVEFVKDTVLSVCYRNPREVLVAAHAIGFGIYGNLVQMLEDREYWETIGYTVLENAEFVQGARVRARRPPENSLPIVSDNLSKEMIVQCAVHDSVDSEVTSVADQIQALLRDGLRPDDIAAVVVDDRSVREYLRALRLALRQRDIIANDIHTNYYGVPDFTSSGEVTLTTVHKAKGNEAFVVFVLGVDALFGGVPTVRDRNMLFTAMTRAKGLVRVSGVGEPAAKLKREIDQSLANFPDLLFVYPGAAKLKQIRKDWRREAAKKDRVKSDLDKLLREYGRDVLMELLEQQAKTKKQSE